MAGACASSSIVSVAAAASLANASGPYLGPQAGNNSRPAPRIPWLLIIFNKEDDKKYTVRNVQITSFLSSAPNGYENGFAPTDQFCLATDNLPEDILALAEVLNAADEGVHIKGVGMNAKNCVGIENAYLESRHDIDACALVHKGQEYFICEKL